MQGSCTVYVKCGWSGSVWAEAELGDKTFTPTCSETLYPGTVGLDCELYSEINMYYLTAGK